MPPRRPGQPAESGRHLRPPERSNLAPGEKTHYASKKSDAVYTQFSGNGTGAGGWKVRNKAKFRRGDSRGRRENDLLVKTLRVCGEDLFENRCGGRGLRTFAVRARSPMVGAAPSKAAEALDGASYQLDSKLAEAVGAGVGVDPKGSPGLAPQCFGTSREISPPSTHPRFPGVDAVRPLRGLRGTQYHLKCNASRPGRRLLRLRDPGGTPRRNLFPISG
jgi:hypothetical protein